MKDLLRNTIKEQEETNDKFDRRLRQIFSIMKHIPGIGEWSVWLMENGIPNPWMDNNKYYCVEIANTLRIFGRKMTLREQLKETVTFYETFTQNGGVNRDFNEGELNLTAIKSYEILADATVTIIQRTNINGEVFGVDSESEAFEQVKDNPQVWMEYGDSFDSDYGKIRDVINLESYNVNTNTINPTMVGLK